ncbi:MAG: hypothetical protein ACAH83_03795 [Alphaproteobacteria bacterium]
MRRLLQTSTTVFFALAAALILHPQIACASNKVSSPDVTKGQVELEYRGGYDWDDDTEKQDQQETHKFCVNYGLTDRWRMESKLVAAGRDDDLDWTTLEYSNRYQLLKDKEGWLKLSLQVNYKIALVDGKPDKIEFTTLAAKDTGPLTHITNINFENEVGNYARGGTDINLGWKTKYRWKPFLEPGGEFYADFGKMSGVNVKKYQIGPVIGGKLDGTGLKYDLGYLFALNDNVPDGRAKLILTYAFKP